MNPKIQRIIGMIEKTKEKIAAAQSKLRELEDQKRKLENAELVAAMRGMKATPEEFEAFLAERRGAPATERAQSAETQSNGRFGDEE